MKTELRLESLVIPGVRIGAENPLPMFRDLDADRQIPLHESVPAEKRKYFGWEAGKRILPYRMQDRYTRQLDDYPMHVAILENDYLKATFWIQLGGRLMSLVYKPLDRELLFNNPVFQPANLALRNAWFAGGIEWNVGLVGHHFATCSPVFAAVIRDWQGNQGLRLYDFERCKGLLWQIDFILPEQSELLFAYTRVRNPQDEDTSMYWWTNIAVPENPGTRVLAPSEDAIYIDHNIDGFGFASLPDLPSLPGKDATYSLNWNRASDYFMQCEAADMPWEAALDQDGCGFIEVSTRRLMSRKMFCWGTGRGGRHWQDYLAKPGMAYLEIQAGLAPTQLHHLPFSSHDEWSWTEAFGYLQADPAEVHDPNYGAAWKAVDKVVKNKITPSELGEIEARCRLGADVPAEHLLQPGSGWGALEIARRKIHGGLEQIPPSFIFPATTLAAEQEPWLGVLRGEGLPIRSPEEIPGEWLTQKDWLRLMESSLDLPQHRNWFALLHYGVMLAENREPDRAESAWRESIQKMPSAWAYRNLAAVCQQGGRTADAWNWYELALKLAGSENEAMEPLYFEALYLLNLLGRHQQAWDLGQSLALRAADSDRVQIILAMSALEIGQLDAVEAALKRDFATIREGQVDLTDIWFKLWRRREAVRRKCLESQISLDEIRTYHPAPASIDFRVGP